MSRVSKYFMRKAKQKGLTIHNSHQGRSFYSKRLFLVNSILFDAFTLVTTSFKQIPFAVSGAKAVLSSRIQIRPTDSVFLLTRSGAFVIVRTMILLYTVLASGVQIGAYTDVWYGAISVPWIRIRCTETATRKLAFRRTEYTFRGQPWYAFFTNVIWPYGFLLSRHRGLPWSSRAFKTTFTIQVRIAEPGWIKAQSSSQEQNQSKHFANHPGSNLFWNKR